MPAAATPLSSCASTALLTAVIAVAWVGVAQFARQAELAPACGGPAGGGLGAHSCAHFIVWLNGSSWMFLGLPWLAQRLRPGAPSAAGDRRPATPPRGSLEVDVAPLTRLPFLRTPPSPSSRCIKSDGERASAI